MEIEECLRKLKEIQDEKDWQDAHVKVTTTKLKELRESFNSREVKHARAVGLLLKYINNPEITLAYNRVGQPES